MVGIRSVMTAMAGVALLTGCASSPSSDAPIETVQQAAYRHNGPPALTLYTMINNRSGSGAHSSLMVNGSQRVIFDPAGTVRFSSVPERGDVLYGITPAIKDAYASAHARETYHVIIQRLEVSPEVAERALQLVQARGSVPSAQCALSTSGILRQLPGFQSVGSSWFPERLKDDFAELSGVTTSVLRENDEDDKGGAIAALDAQLRQQAQARNQSR